MKNEQKILNAHQNQFVTELVETYGIEPKDVTFFTDDARPFLSYEATCVIANELTDIRDINIEPVKAFASDSVTLRCTLTLQDGRTRSAVGVANLNETLDGETLSEQQTYLLASSRAIRNALRTAGIDLIKLHTAGGRPALTFPQAHQKSNRNAILSRIHALASELGLIDSSSRAVYKNILERRYGVSTCAVLDDDALADFVAFLTTLAPERAA